MDITDTTQDVFISHATADKQNYILPLASALKDRGITFWLDSAEIVWGDNVLTKINEGLRTTRFMLLCLSHAFLARPWPESEMSAALAIQNSVGIKKVLPLILNSAEAVLRTYPIIAGLAYREFRPGAEAVADDIAVLVRPTTGQVDDSIRVIVESLHTGETTYLRAPRRATVEWLGTTAAAQTGLREFADVGAFEEMELRWIPVDTRLLHEWKALPFREQVATWGMFWKSEGEFTISKNKYDRLDQFAVADGTVFYLCGLARGPVMNL